MRRLGVSLGARRRKATEAEAIDLLLLAGWRPALVVERRKEVERGALAILERFVSLGLGFELTGGGERLFDPGELMNFVQWSHTDRGDPFWSEQSIDLSRRVLWEEHGLAPRDGEQPPPPSTLPPRRFNVRLRRRFDLAGHSPGSSVRLRLPLPIEDESLSELKLTLDPAPGAVLTSAEGRLDALAKVPADGRVELGFVASFIARPTQPAGRRQRLDPEEAALYTRPNEGLIKVTPDARALAAELVDDVSEPWARVELFWRFVQSRLRFGVINYEELDARSPWTWVLENGWCDCQLGSAFLATLCRAIGIPARMLSGYVLDPETPYFHYWLEAWIEDRGWAPIDTVSWSLSCGGRDPLWSDYLIGQVNYRMKTERLPRLFNGAGSVRFPAATMRLGRIHEGGSELYYYDADTRALVYADHIAVLGAAPV